MPHMSRFLYWICLFFTLICSPDAQAEDSIRIQSRWYPDKEINVEKGLALSPAPPNWWSADWIPEPVDSLHIKFKNRWTSDYIRLNNGTLEVAKDPSDSWDTMWEVEPVANSEYFRLRNRHTGAYLNNQNGPLVASTNIQLNWWSAMWLLKGYHGTGTRLTDAQWMRRNGDIIRDKILNKMALPGTHDSGTYDLKDTWLRPVSDAFAPDTDDLKRGLSFTGELGYSLWARAQGKSILEQLRGGIRFLDLRICVDASGNLQTCHGLYAAPVQTVFNDIAQFAQENPREIVIMFFQHVYDWGEKITNGKQNDANYNAISSDGAKKLEAMVSSTLGNYLVPRSGSTTLSPSSTVGQVWATERQVIMIGDLASKIDASPAFNSLSMAPYYWPASETMDYKWDGEDVDRTNRIHEIQAHLTNDPDARKKFLAIPFSLSPPGQVYGKSFDRTSNFPLGLRAMARQVNPVLLSYLWLEWKSLKANIISTDWFEDSCLVAVTHRLNGIASTTTRGCLNRNTTWGDWKLGYERIGEVFTGNPQDYSVWIDNCHSKLAMTNTANTITLTVYDNNGGLITRLTSDGSGWCGPFYSNGTGFTFNTSSKIGYFTLETNGNDAMFIDSVRMTKGKSLFAGGEEVSFSGRNDGNGWCLSTDSNDGGEWKPYALKCSKSIRLPR